MSESVVELSNGRANETVVRIVAGFIVLLTFAAILSGSYWISLYLTIDFFLRALTSVKPPLAIIAKFIADRLSLKPKWIFAPPKKFAAFVGFLFSFTIVILILLDYQIAALAVSAVLLFCAVLESVFSICLGCYFFDLFVAPIKNKLKW